MATGYVLAHEGPAVPSRAAIVTSTGARVHVIGRSTGGPSETPVAVLQFHATELLAEGEEAARVLDAAARETFPKMDTAKGKYHVLQAPAGGGKTSSVCSLCRAQRAARPDKAVLVLVFNRCAALEGSLRTTDDPGIVWRTLDSFLHEVFVHELREELRADAGDPGSVADLCARLLGTAPEHEELRSLSKDLQKALNEGRSDGLTGKALRLFRCAERGEWFDFSTLRMRARGDPRWQAAVADYDTIVVDEAQDMNVVMLDLISEVKEQHMIVFAMDAGQKLYGFMGCRDVTTLLPRDSYVLWTLYLTFRYGSAVCDFVNALRLCRAPTCPALGAPDTAVVSTRSATAVQEPHVALFATWADALQAADRYLAAGRRVSMDSAKREEMLTALRSPEANATSCQQAFRRIGKAGVARILHAVGDCGDKVKDDVRLSTVHGFKGLEAGAVVVAANVIDANGSFTSSQKARAYVAVTRSTLRLYLLERRKRPAPAARADDEDVARAEGEGSD
ncbi:P-loop containing nucleoside triphosphate hydrolase protein [Tribonema minus]|uniref:P-loop containing nucleoside triphosphate hydrolase protein n=1 Tax=Tribonema minus TaxID=303371 RepID=A0A835YX22_9STRA|nr:P-loop containing nucleoside triphosphate hydrolase protein [Tribonema minus]